MKLIPGVRITSVQAVRTASRPSMALSVGRRRGGLEDDVVGDQGERGVEVAGAERRVEPNQRPVVGAPRRVAAEAGQQVVLGVASERASRGDRTSVAVGLLTVVEPVGDRVHQSGIHPGVAAGGHGQVPAVDQVVGSQLDGVLLLRRLAERQVHRAALRAAAVATEAIAARAAARADPIGSSPSTSPSNRSPTSSIVAPSMSGTVQRFS